MGDLDKRISQLLQVSAPTDGDLFVLSRGGSTYSILKEKLLAKALGDLTDVSASSPADSQVLGYSSTINKWVAMTVPLPAHNHNDLYYTQAQITTLLAAKAALAHTHSGGDVTSAVAEATHATSADAAPWSGLTGKPETYPPSAHTHSNIYYSKTELQTSGSAQVNWGNITNVPDFGTGSGDMLKATYDANGNGVVDSAEAVPWSGITGKPETYTPAAHMHDDRYFTETELSSSNGGGSVHWDNVSNKPAIGDMLRSTYDADLDGVVNLAEAVLGAATAGSSKYYGTDSSGATGFYDLPTGGTSTGDMLKSVYDTDGDGTVNAAESVAWSGVTDKPSAYPPEAHNHNDLYYTEAEITDLLVAKAALSHTHSGSDITSTVANASAAPWAGITGKPNTFAPSAHASSHKTGQSDAIAPGDIGAATSSHTHSGADITSSVAAASSVPWSGVSDKPASYAPSVHASSHATGGSDAVTPASIGAAISSHNHDDSYYTKIKLQTAGEASVAYTNLTGTPLSFAPSAHASSHASNGSDPITPANIGAAVSSHTHAGSEITSAVASAEAVPWTGVTDKPSSFTPAAHAATHKTGQADAIAPSDIGAAAASHTHAGADITSTVASASSVPWTGVADKPTSFTPDAHASTHASGGADVITPDAIGAATTSHTHDDRYYTESEVNTFLAAKGDMNKSTYDGDNDGIVDSAKAISGAASAGNSQYYGTNASGAVGFYALPSGSSGSGVSLTSLFIYGD